MMIRAVEMKAFCFTRELLHVECKKERESVKQDSQKLITGRFSVFYLRAQQFLRRELEPNICQHCGVRWDFVIKGANLENI